MCVLVYLIYAVYCIKSQNWSFKKGEKVFKTCNVCFPYAKGSTGVGGLLHSQLRSWGGLCGGRGH